MILILIIIIILIKIIIIYANVIIYAIVIRKLYHLSSVQPPSSGPCLGQPYSGTCNGNLVAWTYNTITRQCETFTWGGCQNSRLQNHYDNIQDCQRACQPGKYSLKKASGLPACLLTVFL